jgi:hypothetical protein
MSSATRDGLTSYLLVFLLFFSSCLIALARSSRTMLNRSGESRDCCLIPDFRRNVFSFSLLSIMLAICLSYIVFIMLRYIPSILHLIRTFIIKWCWILLKDFSVSIEVIRWFLSLLLLICCITFNDMCMLNHPCIPGMKLTWLWCMSFHKCCWTHFAIILLNIFTSIFIK